MKNLSHTHSWRAIRCAQASYILKLHSCTKATQNNHRNLTFRESNNKPFIFVIALLFLYLCFYTPLRNFVTTTVIGISLLNKWSETGLNVGTKQSVRDIQHEIYAMKIIQLLKEATDGVKYKLHC